MLTKKNPKNPKKYLCKHCHFSSSNLKDYNRHITTRKHKMLTNVDKNVDKKNPKILCSEIFSCECGKTYKYRQSLCVHKKKCAYEIENVDNDSINSDLETDEEGNIVMNKILTMLNEQQKVNKELSQTNKELKDVIKEGKLNNTINNNMTNSFNLNVFLNETCKDALNITDFISSLQLKLNDLIETGNLGHVDGISRIFVNALKDLDETQRPIHCTDIKRETVYIKDENQWKKDDDKGTLKTAINVLTDKNLNQLSQWQTEHPQYSEIDTKDNQEYIQISMNSLGGNCEEENDKNKEKIIKNVLKEVTIEKTTV